MFGIYTKQLDTVPVCGDCGCFITGKVYKDYENKSFSCADCLEPWLTKEDWDLINKI